MADKLFYLKYMTPEQTAKRLALVPKEIELGDQPVDVVGDAKPDIIFGDHKPHKDWIDDALEVQKGAINTDQPTPAFPKWLDWLNERNAPPV